MVEPLRVSVCGLMIGSLCNIIIYRLQVGEAMIRPDSHYHLCFAPPWSILCCSAIWCWRADVEPTGTLSPPAIPA